MRYTAKHDAALGETSIELTSNCYTDAFPMLRRILFRRQEVDLSAQALPLACAILTTRYCGDQFEFTGTRIGSDYAEAINILIGGRVSVANVDGMNRTISTGELDVYCSCATDPAPRPRFLRSPSATPLVRTDWSGDFVDVATRRSEGFTFGAYHTNGAFFADPTSVSIAVGLLQGRDRIRTLFVPALDAEDEDRDRAKLAQALRVVGVTLDLVPVVGSIAAMEAQELRPEARS